MTLSASLYFVMAGWVFLGEFIAIIAIGYPLFLYLTKKVQITHRVMLLQRNLDYKF